MDNEAADVPAVEGSLLEGEGNEAQANETQTNTDEINVKIDGFDATTVPEKFVDKDTGVIKLQEILDSNKELEKTLHARAPETYDFDKVFEEHKLVFETPEQEKETIDLFKKHRFSQEAVEDLLAVYGSRQNAVLEQIGPGVDKEQQMKFLIQAWGNQTEAKQTELREFVESKGFPPEVLSHSPMQTAAGLQLLYEMMRGAKGPNVIKSSEMSADDLQTQLNEVIDNPNYHNGLAPDHQKLQAKARELSEKIAEQQQQK